MDPPSSSSIPVRTSGIPRPTSRLPVLKPSSSQSQLRQTASNDQLRKRPSLSSLSKPSAPSRTQPSLQKKSSRSSLARPPSSTSTTLSSNRLSQISSSSSATRRPLSTTTQSKPTNSDADVFKKPIGRPPSRQTRPQPQPRNVIGNKDQNEDVLGDLEGFRSSSRASSRQGFRDAEPEYVLEDDPEPHVPTTRKSRPSLSDRTIESLSQLPSSPAGKTRRRSSFFSADNSMAPPPRPGSQLGDSRRPMTSDGTPRATPSTPSRLAGPSQRGSMTAPGKRSVSAATPSTPTATPSKLSTVSRPTSTIKKPPLSQMQNLQSTPKTRPLSNSKTMTARTPKSRLGLSGVFGEAVSPQGTIAPQTPSPNRGSSVVNQSPASGRKVSSSSAALREQIARAKAEARTSETAQPAVTPKKAASSSGALREQIAKAKEAARRAHHSPKASIDSPAREVPAVTENEHGVIPDPAEIAEFDFGLDDPFNQRAKGSKSLLRKRVDSARVDGRLNIAAMGLNEIPDDVLNMYKYNPDDGNIAWGEVVDLTAIIAADNELAALPNQLFPDIDPEGAIDDEDAGPQFGGVQSLDLHGNVLCELPVGLRWLSQLTKLNLARNKLTVDVFESISQVPSLRELRLSENSLEGSLPQSLGNLTALEVLELQGNKLNSLPDEIKELVHLRTLNISDNRFKALPSTLFTSMPLIELLATNNAFSGSFFSVETVPHLQILNLSKNAITSLCEDEAISFPALKTLNISVNRLTSLPDMSSWTSLITLLAAENKLTQIPEGFTLLQQLHSADFTANDLTKLDERIGLMESLENLTVSANPLRDRKFLTMNTEDIKQDLMSRLEPSAIEAINGDDATPEADSEATFSNGWELTRTGTLDLSFKNMTELGSELASFAEKNDIRQLHLQQNYFTSIPPILSQLTFLTMLDLSKNNISDPFTTRLSLPKLRELRLHGNKLQSFEPIMSSLQAPYLQHLDVSNNRITGPLPRLRNTFGELNIILAADNSITEVEAESLEGLKIVNLSNNEIPRLEPRIGLLAGTLTSLDIEGNRFRVPNYAVLQKGTDAVLAWLRDKIPSPVEEFFGV